MKTMQDFAAQQLSKKQMNQVRGGTYICACKSGSSHQKIQIIENLDDYPNLIAGWIKMNCETGGDCRRVE